MPKTCATGVLIVLLLASQGCVSWHNPRTGETRDSVPTYSECKKPEVVYDIDQSCWRACMDRYYRARGMSNAGACDRECTGNVGTTVMVDDYQCNAQKARQEGWITK